MSKIVIKPLTPEGEIAGVPLAFVRMLEARAALQAMLTDMQRPALRALMETVTEVVHHLRQTEHRDPGTTGAPTVPASEARTPATTRRRRHGRATIH